jgi:hypothetical protein
MLSKAAYEYFIGEFDESYCTGIIKHCIDGSSPESYAAVINSTPEVFAYWAVKFPEFEIAIHVAFWKSFAWWEGALRTNDTIDAKVYKLVMAQRFKWSENGSDAQKMLRALSDEQLEDLARRLLSGEKVKEIPVIVDTDEDLEDE